MLPNQPNHFRQARQEYHLEAELSVAFSFPLDPEKVQKMRVILPPYSFPSEGPFAFEITLLQFSLRLCQGPLISLITMTSAPLGSSEPTQTTLSTKAGLSPEGGWGGWGGSMSVFPLSLWVLQKYSLQQRLISHIVISGKDSLLHLFRFKYKIIFF